MPKHTAFARKVSMVSIVWIACIAGCSGQPSPPSAGSPAGPGTAAPGPGSSGALPERPGTPPGAGEPCDLAECGPAMRMPVRRCPDGSIGGPTGRCLRKPDGACAWEVRPCPPG
jgi:hypothetical protein